MHIKTGTWESSNAVCESDPLCDPAVLVSPSKPEPQIRNRRLSPGSGSCGGGGGGCTSMVVKSSRQASPSNSEGYLNGSGHIYTPKWDRDRRATNKGRSFRRDGPRPGPRTDERPSRTSQNHALKERWVVNSLSLLKPPPAFPVKDSPAKLQPTVSYASKVKAGGGSVSAAEEPPGICVLLQNQWGLSFISDGPPADGPPADVPQAIPGKCPVVHPVAGEVTEKPPQSSSESLPSQFSRGSESSEELLLSCRHLEEALAYHTQEWKAILWKQKKDPAKVVWYNNTLESPA